MHNVLEAAVKVANPTAPLVPTRAGARSVRFGQVGQDPFPWMLAFCVWALLFMTQHTLEAPALWLDGGGASSDMADKAFDGDLKRRIGIVLLGAIGCFLLVRARGRLCLNWRYAVPLVAYLAWAAASVTWSEDPSLTFRREVAYGLLLLCSAGCVTRLGLDGLSRLTIAIAMFSIPLGVIAEYRYKGLGLLSSDSRFGGTLHPNLTGASLSIAVILLVWWAYRTSGTERLMWAALGSATFGLVMLTRSRTCLLSLLCVLFLSFVAVAVVNHRGAIRKLAGVFAIAVGIACLGGLAISSGLVDADVTSAIRQRRDEGDVSNLTGRVDLWKLCLRFAAERPMLGVGFDTFWSARRIELVSDELSWSINQAHSSYVDQLLSLGIPGVSLYVILLLGTSVSCFRRFVRGDTQYGPWAAVCGFVILHNFTESINVLPTFPNFFVHAIMLHLAFLKTPS